jgi:hypothetical protein
LATTAVHPRTLVSTTRVGRLSIVLLGSLLLLAPSAWFAWRYRANPQLSAYHDDAVYWLSARSLATEGRFSIPHIPEQPAQTKYPPLYPALMSAIWAANPNFPQNMPAATALQWSFLPLLLGLAFLYYRRAGFPQLPAYLLTLVLAVTPMTIVFSTSLMTELPCTAALLAVLLMVETEERLSTRRALLAGFCAAAAFLIRTNVIVLIVSVPALLILRRSYRSAIAFASPLFVAIAGWFAWCAAHASPFHDDILSYYTSYVGFYIKTFSWHDLPLRLWVNADAICESMARLVLFQNSDEIWFRLIGWLITAAAVRGVVTLYRRGVRHYVAFAVLLIGVLLLWQYPPDHRFVYPIFPLYVAGLATQLAAVVALIAKTWRLGKTSDRVAAVFVFATMSAIVGGCAASIVSGVLQQLPEYYHDREVQAASMLPAYRWIGSNIPTDARFAAYDDTLLYLYTGRRGYAVPILPRLVYDSEIGRTQEYVTHGLPELWREKRVNYVIVTEYDFRRDLHKPALESLLRLVQDRTRFEPIYADQTAQLYRFAPSH